MEAATARTLANWKLCSYYGPHRAHDKLLLLRQAVCEAIVLPRLPLAPVRRMVPLLLWPVEDAIASTLIQVLRYAARKLKGSLVRSITYCL